MSTCTVIAVTSEGEAQSRSAWTTLARLRSSIPRELRYPYRDLRIPLQTLARPVLPAKNAGRRDAEVLPATLRHRRAK